MCVLEIGSILYICALYSFVRFVWREGTRVKRERRSWEAKNSSGVVPVELDRKHVHSSHSRHVKRLIKKPSIKLKETKGTCWTTLSVSLSLSRFLTATTTPSSLSLSTVVAAVFVRCCTCPFTQRAQLAHCIHRCIFWIFYACYDT